MNESVLTAPARQISRPRGRVGDAVFYALMTAVALTFFFPFVWAITTSLKTPPELLMYPPRLVPAVLQWRNYAHVFRRVTFLAWAGNTATVVALGTVGQVLSASLAGYAFARFDFKGRNALFILTLGTMMLPDQVTLIPQFILFFRMGWINTLKPLWVPAWFGGGAFAIFLMRQFLMQLPRELDEAAIIDGAGSFRIYWQLLMPLCKPVLATLAVISVIGRWNDYFGPLIYLNQEKKFTLSVGLTFFRRIPEAGLPTEHYLMAASTLMTLPLIVLFFSAQRYFVQGIALTGIKG
ncbi:MAG: carbohydrate ABC transporter permease [Chloroflexota bacterium]